MKDYGFLDLPALVLGAAIALSTAATSASALTIDLAPPGGPSDGPAYSQNGFTFTNSLDDAGSYGNWVPRNSSLNASNSNGDLYQNNAGTSNTITNDASQPFSFNFIGLADIFNDGIGGNISFTFHHVGGGSDSTVVSLISGVFGLQTFSFVEDNLTSVVFTPTTTEGPFIQFDNIGVNGMSAVPEPSTWAMMLFGFAGVCFMTYRRKAKPALLAA